MIGFLIKEINSSITYRC